jgi:hypothetical protein
MTCIHPKEVLRAGEWFCSKCDEKMPDSGEVDWSARKTVGSITQHDIDNINPEFLETDKTLMQAGLSGRQQEKVYGDIVTDARSNYQQRKDVKAHYKIPRPVYFARIKEDPKYFENPKNLERYSDWKIS